MYYKDDREFSNFVHEKIAKKYIYPKLSWIIQDVNTFMLENVDINNSVDYFAIDKSKDKIITIQERFRESKYSNYNDFTIRYKREFNKNENRLYSEFFKLNVDYFVYGIINQSKNNVDSNAKFIKYAVINIHTLMDLIEQEKIVIEENAKTKFCSVYNEKLYCPVIQNFDKSSSFVPFDISMMKRLFPNGLIIDSYGF